LKGRKDEEENVSSYRIILRKQENSENWKGIIDRTLWETRFGRGCGPVLRQTTGWWWWWWWHAYYVCCFLSKTICHAHERQTANHI